MPGRTVQTQAIITYYIEEDMLEHYGIKDGDWNALDIAKVVAADGDIDVKELIDLAESVDLNPTSWKFVETNRTRADGNLRLDESVDGDVSDMAVGKDSSVQKAGDLVDDQKQRDAAGQPSQEEVTSQQKRAAEEAVRGDTVEQATDRNNQEGQKASTSDDTKEKGLRAGKGTDDHKDIEPDTDAKAQKSTKETAANPSEKEVSKQANKPSSGQG